MIETITTIISDMSTTIEINTTYEVSSKDRLKQMRLQKGASYEMARAHHDNCLRGQLQAVFCMNRIKHANRLGLFYWHHDRESYSTDLHLAEMYSKRHTAQTVYLEMLSPDASERGTQGLAKYGMGAELSCLSNFMAASVKDRMVGKYVLFNSTNALTGPSQPQMLALPDKESASYRQQYANEQERYAYRLSEQQLFEESIAAEAEEKEILAIGWEATPPEIQGSALAKDAPMLPMVAPKNTRKPRKKTERTALVAVPDETINLEEMQLGQATPAVKKRGAAAPKATVKKEKNSSKTTNKGGKSTKPTLTLVP